MSSQPKPQELFEQLAQQPAPQLAVPNKDLDQLVQDIFEQAKDHRSLLVKFYIWYTAILSGLVMVLILWQASARFFVYGKETVELIPEWALNLIIMGMFGQFLGLLTIVTKRVWEFKPFLDHANQSSGSLPKKSK